MGDLRVNGPVIAVDAWTWLGHLGGLSLIVVGIIDSSPLPAPGSQDFLTVFLAAGDREWWPYYAALATLGSGVGGYLTYRLGRKGGERALDERLSPTRVRKMYRLFERWGFSAIFVPALLPPPVPTTAFLLSAGALNYPVKKFLAALTAGRALRYTAVAYLASVFGGRAWRLIAANAVAVAAILVVLGVGATAAFLLRRQLRKAH